MSMMSEFRDFAMRGNVVDMAVGIVIGGAFGKIVSSLNRQGSKNQSDLVDRLTKRKSHFNGVESHNWYKTLLFN